jgi:hypothetical protein
MVALRLPALIHEERHRGGASFICDNGGAGGLAAVGVVAGAFPLLPCPSCAMSCGLTTGSINTYNSNSFFKWSTND